MLWVLSDFSLSAFWVLSECSLSAKWLLTYPWLIAWRFEPEWWRLRALDKLEPDARRLWFLELLSEPKSLYLFSICINTHILGWWKPFYLSFVLIHPFSYFSKFNDSNKKEQVYFQQTISSFIECSSLYHSISITTSEKFLGMESNTISSKEQNGMFFFHFNWQYYLNFLPL